MKNRSRGSTDTSSVLGLFIIGVFLMFGVGACHMVMGTHGFGPERTYRHMEVTGKHVDVADKSSAYMVSTTQGTFEVENGMWLGVWNADEIYGKIQVGHTYTFVAKGNRVVGFWNQQYPYILSVTEEAKE